MEKIITGLLISFLFCLFLKSYSSRPIRTKKIIELKEDTLLQLKIIGKYQNFREIQFEKRSNGKWFKKYVFSSIEGTDSVIQVQCLQCEEVLDSSFLNFWIRMGSNAISFESCFKVISKDLINDSTSVVKIQPSTSLFYIQLKFQFGQQTYQLNLEDPISAIEFCPYKQQWLKLFSMFKTFLILQ